MDPIRSTDSRPRTRNLSAEPAAAAVKSKAAEAQAEAAADGKPAAAQTGLDSDYTEAAQQPPAKGRATPTTIQRRKPRRSDSAVNGAKALPAGAQVDLAGGPSGKVRATLSKAGKTDSGGVPRGYDAELWKQAEARVRLRDGGENATPQNIKKEYEDLQLKQFVDRKRAEHLEKKVVPGRYYDAMDRLNPLTDQQKSKIESAAGEMKSRLAMSPFTADLMKDTVRTAQGLDGRLLNNVVSQLGDAEMARWAGSVNKLEPAERKAFLEDLAKKLDAKQLTRFLGNLKDPKDVAVLGKAVAKHGAPEFRALFAGYAATALEKNPEAARAVGEALASLKGHPKELGDALRLLKPNLKNALQKLAGQDPGLAGRALEAVASHTDAKLKADVVGDGVAAMEASGGKAAAALRDGLTRVVDSDVTGILQKMNKYDINGSHMRPLCKALLQTGQAGQKKMSEWMAKMHSGNSLKQDSTQRMQDPQAVRDLGYLVGAFCAGVNGLTDDYAAKVDTIKNVYGGIAGVLGAAHPVAGAVAAACTTLLNMAGDWQKNSVAEQNKKLRQWMVDTAQPRLADGSPDQKHRTEYMGRINGIQIQQR